jgi:hypothetical protein
MRYFNCRHWWQHNNYTHLPRLINPDMRQLRLLLILILGFAWSQDLFAQDDPSPVQTICEGTIRPYRVDKDENGGAGTTDAQYAWSITSGAFLGTITNNQGPVVAWSPTGSTNRIIINWGATAPGNYVLTVIETINGCDGDPINLNITITPKVDPTFATFGPYCLNAAPALLPPTSIEGIDGTWSPTSINTSAPGTTTYTFTPAADECAEVYTTTITITPLPTVSIAGIASICPGGTTTLTASGAPSYTWSPSAGLSATVGSIVDATPASTATYTVTGTDGAGCSATDVITITVNPLPTITTSGDVAICDDGSTLLQAFGGTSYTWSPATNLSATSGQSVTADPNSTITYTVTGTDGNGCENTATVEVTVNPIPTIVTTIPATCAADLLTYNLTVVSTGIVTSTAGTVANTGGNNWSITLVPAGTNIVLTTTLGTCDETLLIGAPNCLCPPVADAISLGDDDFCTGSAIPTLGVQAVSGIAFDWYSIPSGGIALATNTNTFTPTAAGIYFVQARDILTACLSSTRTQITLVENALPTVDATLDFAICEGAPASLSASGAVSYEWVGTGLVSNIGADVTANLADGVFTFTVTGTDGNGCTDSENIEVTVNPVPTITVVNGPVCSADLTTWSMDISVSAGTPTSSAGTVTPTGGNNYTIAGVPAGTNITISLTVAGCPTTLDVTAPVCNCPTVNVPVGTDAAYCAGFTPVPALTATVDVGLIINWYDAPTGGNLIGTGSPFNPPAPGNYYAEAVDNLTGCVSSTRDEVTLTENPLPNVTASANISICEGENTELTAGGATTLTWDNAGSLSSGSGSPVTATPTTTTTYTVTGTNTFGCQETATVTVTVNPRPTTTTIFHD